MKRCNARPYEGDAPYIFVSYCHKDRSRVFPVIETLRQKGYRVWYDEGIDPGSEWPEVIANHLNGCSLCLAFISAVSLESHNCRREISFALLKKKPFISVVMEPVTMSLGIEMQLSATQSIFRYTLPGDREFYQKLLESPAMVPCMDKPDDSIVISAPEYYENEEETPFAAPPQEPETPAEPEPSDDGEEEPIRVKFVPIQEELRRPEPPREPEPLPVQKPAPHDRRESKRHLHAQEPVEAGEVEEHRQRSRKKLFIGLSVLGVAALVFVILMFTVWRSVEIAGIKIPCNETHFSFYKATITGENMEDLKKLTTVSLTDCTIQGDFMEKMARLPNIEGVALKNCDGVEDISAFTEMKNLHRLELVNCDLSDGDTENLSLAKCGNLSQLNLSDNVDLTNLDFLSGTEALTTVNLSGTGVKDLTALRDNRSLSILQVAGTGLSDLSTLYNTSLTELDVSGNQISDLTSAADCADLRKLQCSENPISDLKPLAACKKLVTVEAANTGISSLEGLESALELRTLNARGNHLTELSPLKDTTQLENVDLRENALTEVGVLASNIKTLRRVRLDANQLTDILPLAGSENLELLGVSDNQLTDLSPLQQSGKLVYLIADRNRLLSLFTPKGASNLDYISLSGNRLYDVSELDQLLPISNKTLYLDLRDNRFSSFKLKSLKTGGSLMLYGNPISEVKNYQAGVLMVPYMENVKIEDLRAMVRGSLVLLDCPKNLQVEYKKACPGIIFADRQEADRLTRKVYDEKAGYAPVK